MAAPVDQPDGQSEDNADAGANEGAEYRRSAERPPDEAADDGEDKEETSGGGIAAGHAPLMPEPGGDFHKHG
jgi:hypothetical protein